SSLYPRPSSRSLLTVYSHDPPPTQNYTLSLHDALPISPHHRGRGSARTSSPFGPRRRAASPPRCGSPGTRRPPSRRGTAGLDVRSEEHTSELQSRFDLVCRLLLEKKKNNE